MVVSWPPGSRARMPAAATARPYLPPDSAGRYALQVVVEQFPMMGSVARLIRTQLLCSSNGATAQVSGYPVVSTGPVRVAVDTIVKRVREDLTGSRFAFVNVERVPIDTADPNASPAVVTVGSKAPGNEVLKTTYTSDRISGPGFFLLDLNAGDLSVIDQETIQDNLTSGQTLSCLALVLRIFASDINATADNRFLQNHQLDPTYSSAKLLGQIFKARQNDPIQTAPMFNPLQFPLGTQDNLSANTQTVTPVCSSVRNSDGTPHSSNLACQVA
jgi:hypothetical protein